VRSIRFGLNGTGIGASIAGSSFGADAGVETGVAGAVEAETCITELNILRGRAEESGGSWGLLFVIEYDDDEGTAAASAGLAELGD
jgi:hypothetical protein